MARDLRPVVETTGLTKDYRDFWGRTRVRALDGLALHIAPGEVYGLLGPNGSGKSTTIKLLLGLLRPTAGRVSVHGRSPDASSTRERLGYLPEASYLYHHLTPRETLTFYGEVFALSRQACRERTDQLLEMVDLAHVADRPVGEFSKGMARRVGLAQALINNPDLVILDEPTSGLDPIGCRQVKDLILALAAQGKTVLLSSHLLADVEDVCDRVGILYGGRLQAEGAVSDLLTLSAGVQLSLAGVSEFDVVTVQKELETRFGCAVALNRPTVTLEEFFLSVVSASERGEHAGGTMGRRSTVAAFLGERSAGAGVAESKEPETC